MNKNHEKLISYLLVLIGAVVYVSLVFNKNVWLDEAFTATLIRTNMAGVIERSMNDTLPPLYNILLKITTDIFGYTVPVMKLTSVLPMVLTMLISATTVRKRHGFIVSSIFTVCLFTMPNLLFYGVEIRMYSLGFFFATASAVYMYECICDSKIKNWVIFIIVSVLAGYSHHFAFVAVGFVYLILLLYYIVFEKKNIKRFFICLLATFVLYVPCLIVTIKQIKSVSGYFSMPEVTLPVFIKYGIYPYIVGNKIVSVLLFLCVMAAFVLAAAELFKGSGDLVLIYGVCLFLAYYGVLVFGTIVSKIMTANIFVDRYLLFAHGFIWMFFALSVKAIADKCRNVDEASIEESGAGRRIKNYIGKYITPVIFMIIIVSGIVGYAKEFKIEYGSSPDKLISFLAENVREGDVLYTIEEHEEMKYCIPFYDERITFYDDINKAAKAADINNGSIWVTVMDYCDTDVSGLSEKGYNIEYIDDFSFDRYNFYMYKIAKN